MTTLMRIATAIVLPFAAVNIFAQPSENFGHATRCAAYLTGASLDLDVPSGYKISLCVPPGQRVRNVIGGAEHDNWSIVLIGESKDQLEVSATPNAADSHLAVNFEDNTRTDIRLKQVASNRVRIGISPLDQAMD